MILHEVNAALTYLLIQPNVSIVIHDTDSAFAQEVIYYLSQLFDGLKCDYHVVRITDQSYEVFLYQ
jgi:hypothetical protein